MHFCYQVLIKNIVAGEKVLKLRKLKTEKKHAFVPAFYRSGKDSCLKWFAFSQHWRKMQCCWFPSFCEAYQRRTVWSMYKYYTPRNAQVAANLLSPSRYQLGCVLIACSSLMITSLLRLVNRLAASCELHAGLIHVSSTCSKSANI